MGEGPMISLSAVTDRKLTKKIIAIAERLEMKHKKVVEATSTGTNSSCVYCVNEGIPVAVVSIPLAGMHSYNESLCLDDAEAFIRLIGEIVNVCADESVLREDGSVDMAKLRPIAYDPMNHDYLLVTEKVGNAFEDGVELK